jgi:hypothetical protein
MLNTSAVEVQRESLIEKHETNEVAVIHKRRDLVAENEVCMS